VALPVAVAALAFIAAVAVVNLVGILASVRLNVAFTLVELGGLLLVAAIAVAALAAGEGDPGRAVEFKPGAAPLLAVFGGAAVAFYALIGFEDSVNIAEETTRPERSYPPALFAGLAAAGAIYIVVTAVASMAVPTARLEASSGALLEVVQLGPLAVPTKVFSAIGLIALANGALINMIMASRLLYGMASEAVLPSALARLSGRGAPAVAIAFTTLIAAGLILTGDLGALVDTTVLLLLGVFVAVNVAALRLRSDRVRHPHFEVPLALPPLGIGACLLVMTQVEAATWLRAGALLCLGLALWAIQRLAAR
jgi:amino acid transporter